MTDFKLNNDVFVYENKSKYNIVLSSRNGGCSSEPYNSLNLGLHVDDEYKDVRKNRMIYSEKLGVNFNDNIYMHQTHSKNSVEVTVSDKSKGLNNFEDGISDTDAIYSFEDDVVLNAMCADCTPVYFYSDKHNLKGVIHAGWQGTLKEITFYTLNNIITKHSISPEDLTVIIGPSISIDSFEVDFDVFDKFDKANLITEDNYYQKGEKYHINIKEINKIQAIKLGITNIFVSSIDTYTNDDLFSFRKENKTGRMCATIFNKK